MKKLLLTTFAVATTTLLLSGCFIKEPKDQDILGPPTSLDQITQAEQTALTVANPDSLFRVGDVGTTVVMDASMASQVINPPHSIQLKSIDLLYYHFFETDAATGITYEDKWERYHSAPQVTSIGSLFKWVGFKLSSIFSTVSIEFTQAVGDENPVAKRPLYSNRLTPVFDREINQALSRLIREDSKKALATMAATATASSATPDPSPAQVYCNTPAAGSQYYGLKTQVHDLPVLNCGQIPSCKVSATRIEYNEMCHVGGMNQQIHWSYELSTEVPGRFSVMEQCFTTMRANQGSEIPWTHCNRVYDFRFGSN